MALIRIYTLTDPRTNQVFYVGASCQSDTMIMGRHMVYAFNNPIKWELKKIGHKPVLGFLDEATTIEQAAHLEEYWYHQLKAWGFPLTNRLKKDGGFFKYMGDTNGNNRWNRRSIS